jgi:predicted enzyme related to lactoylglutathione lyase
MRELAPEQAGVPPHWMPYFTAASADEVIAAVQDGGGSLVAGPIEIPTGARLVVLQDPQGAVFAIFEGEVDD